MGSLGNPSSLSCSSTLDAECMRSDSKQTVGNDSTQEWRMQYRETVQVIYLHNITCSAGKGRGVWSYDQEDLSPCLLCHMKRYLGLHLHRYEWVNPLALVAGSSYVCINFKYNV